MSRLNPVDFYTPSDMIASSYDTIFSVYVSKLIGCIRGHAISDYALLALVHIF